MVSCEDNFAEFLLNETLCATTVVRNVEWWISYALRKKTFGSSRLEVNWARSVLIVVRSSIKAEGKKGISVMSSTREPMESDGSVLMESRISERRAESARVADIAWMYNSDQEALVLLVGLDCILWSTFNADNISPTAF